jgi:hypothetical protein
LQNVTTGAFTVTFSSGGGGTAVVVLLQGGPRTLVYCTGQGVALADAGSALQVPAANFVGNPNTTGPPIPAQPMTAAQAKAILAITANDVAAGTFPGATYTFAQNIIYAGAYASNFDTIFGASGTNRSLIFQTGATAGASLGRWAVIADATAEGAGNVGSNFVVARYDNGGNFIDEPFTIQRSSGVANFGAAGLGIGGNLTVSGAASINNGLTANTLNVTTSGAVIHGGLTVYNGLSGSGGLNFDAITAGSSFVSDATTTLQGPATAPTPAKGDNSGNIATTSFVHLYGIQSGGQSVLTGPTYVLGLADAGRNLLAGGITGVTFPTTGGPNGAAGGTYLINNTGNADVALNIPGGTDFRNVLHAGEQVILSGDGGGFFRVLATGNGAATVRGPASLGGNGYDTSPNGRITQWGTSGSIPANGLGAISFPKQFGSVWNVTFTPTGSAGTGGMAYAYPTGLTVNGFNIFNAGANAVSFYWRAEGV